MKYLIYGAIIAFIVLYFAIKIDEYCKRDKPKDYSTFVGNMLI